MKTLSISVAAYNMERLIGQNLDSFVSSPVASDIEVLVINDGSTDSTADIVKKYELKFPGIIRLINQVNAGPGSTVNRGLENATGKYFRMVDADDWVDDGFAEYVEALKASDADMVLTDYTLCDAETGETQLQKVQGVTPGKVIPFDSVCEKLSTEMHAVTFLTSLLKSNNIRVFNGFYTDIQYLLFPSPFVKTVQYVECNVYMYRVSLSGQSMSAGSMQKNITMHDAMLFSLVDLYNRVESSRPKVAKYIMNKLITVAGSQMSTLLSFVPSKERKRDLYVFFSRLNTECPAVYDRFSKLKTVRVLHIMGGVFYPAVSRMHRKKLGLDK